VFPTGWSETEARHTALKLADLPARQRQRTGATYQIPPQSRHDRTGQSHKLRVSGDVPFSLGYAALLRGCLVAAEMIGTLELVLHRMDHGGCSFRVGRSGACSIPLDAGDQHQQPTRMVTCLAASPKQADWPKWTRAPRTRRASLSGDCPFTETGCTKRLPPRISRVGRENSSARLADR
jgi:hypothetical protein